MGAVIPRRLLACDAAPRRLVAPNPSGMPIRPVRPNLGLAAAYRKRMDRMIEAMQASLLYWLKAAYRAAPPEMAQDEATGGASARRMRKEMDKLSKKWQGNFDEGAEELGKWFATKAADRSDAQLKAILKQAGFTVEFKMGAAANDVLQATIGEQVGLIRSIASEHLADVQGIVMRSVQTGRDLGTLTKEIEARYGAARSRAALIARDQNNKATAAMTRARQTELGITKAKWRHSRGGRHPRPSHVAADGEEYDVAKGMYLDGVWTWPGVEINCRCVSQPIIPGFDAP